MKLTNVFKYNIQAYKSGKRFIINQGGTSSSKTWSILQLLSLLAQKKDNLLISVVSESLPHLKRGAMRDFIKILEGMGLYSKELHNKTMHAFKLNNSTVEFFGADDSAKMRGARRNILYVNEINNVDKKSFDELSIRTSDVVFCDYNPVSEFYIHEFMQQRSEQDYAFIKSTFKDNQYLDANIIQDIQSRAAIDPAWYRIYGEGEIGNYEGVIYDNWKIIQQMPESPKRVIGLDFGYTNDPTAIVDVRYSDGQLFWDELLYQKAMTNSDIGLAIKQLCGQDRPVVICDSAEPKSIAELSMMGIRAIAATKGADSLRTGIDTVKRFHLNITDRSLNLKKEIRNYRWREDSQGKRINEPVDFWNHALDAARYATVYLCGSIKTIQPPRIYI